MRPPCDYLSRQWRHARHLAVTGLVAEEVSKPPYQSAPRRRYMIWLEFSRNLSNLLLAAMVDGGDDKVGSAATYSDGYSRRGRNTCRGLRPIQRSIRTGHNRSEVKQSQLTCFEDGSTRPPSLNAGRLARLLPGQPPHSPNAISRNEFVPPYPGFHGCWARISDCNIDTREHRSLRVAWRPDRLGQT